MPNNRGVTDTTLKVLDALETYRYLTRDQIIKLGICKDKTHLGKLIRIAERAKLIGEMSGGMRRAGRQPDIIYLKRGGAEILADFHRVPLEDIIYISQPPIFKDDYTHRRYCVDFHIVTAQYFREHLTLFTPYYAYTGAKKPNFTKSVRVRLPSSNFIPDALFRVDKDGKTPLYAMEMCVNPLNNDTRRIINQLNNHLIALKNGSIGDHLDIAKSNFVLCIFERKSTLELVRKLLATKPEFAEYGLHFKAAILDTITPENWGDIWQPLILE